VVWEDGGGDSASYPMRALFVDVHVAVRTARAGGQPAVLEELTFFALDIE